METHCRHCVVSLSKTLGTGTTQEHRVMLGHDRKIVEWDVKHQPTHTTIF